MDSALNCLIVANARLMLAAFLTWLALPALSSAPHLVGNHFSVIGASLTGPFRVWAEAAPAKHRAPTAAAMTVNLFIKEDSSWLSSAFLVWDTVLSVGLPVFGR